MSQFNQSGLEQITPPGVVPRSKYSAPGVLRGGVLCEYAPTPYDPMDLLGGDKIEDVIMSAYADKFDTIEFRGSHGDDVMVCEIAGAREAVKEHGRGSFVPIYGWVKRHEAHGSVLRIWYYY